ncbi:undecaprenyl/decaprenyl-phosphate alpha-N-acetylglucosaminyl 1-phosphate transferase [bacterium]|nr:undecaprenyl/decaprenyl-phosphate alpha-N-acetylglucosaminyl 1-phosphate transferase [bacterium]
MLGFIDYLTSPTCWALLLGCFLATSLLTPLVTSFAHRIGAVDKGGYRKIFKGTMPLLGGLTIAIPFVGVCVLGLFKATFMFGTIQEMRWDLLSLVIGSAAIVGVGIVDDTWGMKPRTKLAFQSMIALFVAVSGHTVETLSLPLLGEVYLGSVVGTIFTVVWIVGMINAFNLIDGVDGLATGVGLIGSVGLAILSMVGGHTFVALLSLALAGSLAAFLVVNFHPARMFLGDTGSMLIGFLLSGIALIGSFKTQTAAFFVAPMLVMGLPIFETLVSMIRRYLSGHSLFVGDNRHTHHRLLRKGLSQRRAVLFLYAVSLLFVASGVIQTLFPGWDRWQSWASVSLAVGAVMWTLRVAGYFEKAPSTNLKESRKRNNVYSAFSRYAGRALRADFGSVSPDHILGLGRAQLDLNLLEAWFKEGPVLIGSSEASDEWDRDSVEELEVESKDGREIIVLYQFRQEPDESESHNVAACLASIFDGCHIRTAGVPNPADLQTPSPQIVYSQMTVRGVVPQTRQTMRESLEKGRASDPHSGSDDGHHHQVG